MEASSKQYEVPCNGCTLCCRDDAIRLLPEDDVTQYRTEPHFLFPGQQMLAHNGKGECVYLDDNGCTIHDTRPLMCQRADCRNIAKALSYTKARKMKGLNMTVWRKGKSLLR